MKPNHSIFRQDVYVAIEKYLLDIEREHHYLILFLCC
jgi:hypothetical protein